MSEASGYIRMEINPDGAKGGIAVRTKIHNVTMMDKFCFLNALCTALELDGEDLFMYSMIHDSFTEGTSRTEVDVSTIAQMLRIDPDALDEDDDDE